MKKQKRREKYKMVEIIEHIKDGIYLRDILDEYEVAEGIAENVSKKMGLKDKNELTKALKHCKGRKTDEGFETCLLLWRESIIGLGGGYKPEFEELVKHINDETKYFKAVWYNAHKL